ncbi:hypothetical protein OH76DRAFT_432245 [Lentinus brumalis]|uniref:Uncharacterized protein n=1 Tax=Lentinus brumalis TaxID=2498619 RepID=A0A371DDK4_9APHY|nr:hypothetical protein OH76DRAFT_432245 [Polyporus brumalis]
MNGRQVSISYDGPISAVIQQSITATCDGFHFAHCAQRKQLLTGTGLVCLTGLSLLLVYWAMQTPPTSPHKCIRHLAHLSQRRRTT